MNRFTAAGLHAAATGGETITVVALTLHVAEHHFNDYLHWLAGDDSHSESRVNGKLGVRYPSGGAIHFTSYSSPKRGTSTPVALCYDFRTWCEHAAEWQQADFLPWATELIAADD